MMDSQVQPQGLHPLVKEVLVAIQFQKEDIPVVVDFQAKSFKTRWIIGTHDLFAIPKKMGSKSVFAISKNV